MRHKHSPKHSIIESVLSDTSLINELRENTTDDISLPKVKQLDIPAPTFAELVRNPSVEKLDERPFSEAIILEFGRPVLLIQNDTFEMPPSKEWSTRLLPNKSVIDKAIRSVGRLEVEMHRTLDWIGTAWMIAEDVAVTNRHVAVEFARRARGEERRFEFQRGLMGQPMQAYVDFREEFGLQSDLNAFEYQVQDILFIADEFNGPDLALVRLSSDKALPPPITLSRKKISKDLCCCVIGYPARDSRNDEEIALRIFGDVYNVKRLAPGRVMGFEDNEETIFNHDCTTLGGNSGSVVLDISTGEAIGLHFAGRFKVGNSAVSVPILLEALRRFEIKIPVSSRSEPKVPVEIEARQPTDYHDRNGYEEDFLGVGELVVSLPSFDAANVATFGGGKQVLKYRNFSVVMNAERRLALLTAVNVDGNDIKRIPRPKKFFKDPRLDSDLQIGEELYADNDLDRGHIVRRLDPVWGPSAQEANVDTFHFTNIAPQHNDFNTKTWNDLEDHILDNADVHNLKLSVFTGPVFSGSDKEYRGVLLPQQYWKVVVMVAQDEKLLATAYMLSQSDLIEEFERVFTFGEFRTYQVEVARIERLTGLDFGNLRAVDPMRREAREARARRILEGQEALTIFGEPIRPDDGKVRVLERIEDIVFN